MKHIQAKVATSRRNTPSVQWSSVFSKSKFLDWKPILLFGILAAHLYIKQ